MLNQLVVDGLNTLCILSFVGFRDDDFTLTSEMEKWEFPALQRYTPLSHMLVVHMVNYCYLVVIPSKLEYFLL